MKKCIMAVGVPASGKSTFLGVYSKHYKIISSDNIIEDIAKSLNITYDEAWPQYIEQVS